jgi:hypothetical protein
MFEGSGAALFAGIDVQLLTGDAPTRDLSIRWKLGDQANKATGFVNR